MRDEKRCVNAREFLTYEHTENIFIPYSREPIERDAMNRRIFVTVIIALQVVASSDYAMSKRPPEKGSVNDDQPLVVSMNEKKRVEGSWTFIDTLNRGKEIGLSDNDLRPIIPESTAVLEDKDGKGPLGGDGFRVQCFASIQIDRVRSEQKQLESKVKYPVYVVFNAPYYKLLVGDFGKRGEADFALAKLKEIGYSDAWVARCKINSAR